MANTSRLGDGVSDMTRSQRIEYVERMQREMHDQEIKATRSATRCQRQSDQITFIVSMIQVHIAHTMAVLWGKRTEPSENDNERSQK